MNTRKLTVLITLLLIALLTLSGCADAAQNVDETTEQVETQSESKSLSESESVSESDSEKGVGDEKIYEKIEPEDAKVMIDDATVVLIDVRTAEEYGEGHIASSVNIPLDVLEAEIGEYVSDYTQPIMVYCRSGNRSAVASDLLKEMGYNVVYDLGGIQSWPYEIEK